MIELVISPQTCECHFMFNGENQGVLWKDPDFKNYQFAPSVGFWQPNQTMSVLNPNSKNRPQ